MIYVNFRNTFCWLIVAILVMCPSVFQSQSGDWRYAYFFSGRGEFAKVEVATNRVVARGSLLEVKEAHHLFPEFFRETGIGVDCYDRNTGRLYVVGPEEAFLSRDQDGRGTVRYRVIIFELSTLRLIGHVRLAEPVYIGPNLLLTPDGSRLLISYEVVSDDDKHWVFVKEVFDTKSLERVELKRERVAREPYDPEALAKAHFSAKARFAADGKTIIDEAPPKAVGRVLMEGEYEIADGKVQARLLPPWPDEVGKYLKEHPGFQPHRLDEAGRRYLLWELKQNQDFAGKYRHRYSTGRFALYDGLAAKKVREFSVKELEGDFPNIVAISPDGDVMYFAVGNDKLYAVNFRDMTPVRIELSGMSALHVQCLFADR